MREREILLLFNLVVCGLTYVPQRRSDITVSAILFYKGLKYKNDYDYVLSFCLVKSYHGRSEVCFKNG